MSNNNCPLRCVGNYLYNMYVCVRNSCCPRYAVQEAVKELKYKLDVLEAKIAILYECDYVEDIEERLDAIEHEVYGCCNCEKLNGCECCKCGEDGGVCKCGDKCECCKCGESCADEKVENEN